MAVHPVPTLTDAAQLIHAAAISSSSDDAVLLELCDRVAKSRATEEHGVRNLIAELAWSASQRFATASLNSDHVWAARKGSDSGLDVAPQQHDVMYLPCAAGEDLNDSLLSTFDPPKPAVPSRVTASVVRDPVTGALDTVNQYEFYDLVKLSADIWAALDTHVTESRCIRVVDEGDIGAELDCEALLYDHPNIARLHEIVQGESSTTFVVLSAASEGLLAARRDGDGALAVNPAVQTQAQLVEIAKDIARALDHCHSRGVCHADVRGENVLLHRPSGSSPGRITALLHNFSHGTTGYASPPMQSVTALAGSWAEQTGLPLLANMELLSSKPSSDCGGAFAMPSDDVLALGLLLYEMVFKCKPVRDLTRRVMYPGAVAHNRDWRRWRGVLSGALEHDAAQRCTAAKFLDVLSETFDAPSP